MAAQFALRKLRLSTLLQGMATSCDSARSAARRRRPVQADHALSDAQDAVEEALRDADLRISRTRFYSFSRAIRANSDMQSDGASLSGQSDDYFAACVFRRVDVCCLIMR
jgi:hypothetical protein